MASGGDSSPITVLLTGAAGQIAYSLLPLVARGLMFGPAQRVRVHLFDLAVMRDRMEGVRMELEDVGASLVDEVVVSVEAEEAFRGVDYALLVGAKPRGKGMERKDLLVENAAIFVEQGRLLGRFSPACKVLVVGNPANTNAFLVGASGSALDRRNITALTRLDQNRLEGMVKCRRSKGGGQRGGVAGCVVWGNHSATQVGDVSGCEEAVEMGLVEDEAFARTLQQRGKAVIEKRGLSSALSAAMAICDHMRDWVLGSGGKAVSMGVWSEGNPYGIDPRLVFSFPVVTLPGGEWEFATEHKPTVPEALRDRVRASEEELVRERELVEARSKL